MQIDVIDTLEALGGAREDWDAVYACDPEANYYLSHDWFRAWFNKTSFDWFILAAKPEASAPYVAFFPFQMSTAFSKESGFTNGIKMGGSDYADYTGFICRPEFEDAVTVAFASHLKTMSWAKLQLSGFLASHRLSLFLTHFAGPKFVAATIEKHFAEHELNDDLRPQVHLPDSWEDYVSNDLSANTRQKAKRFLKRLDEGSELRVTLADKATFERDLKAMFGYWDKKWRPVKKATTDSSLTNYRVILKGALDAGTLFMPVLWSNDRPVAALGTLIDHKNKRLHFLITGRDETFNSPPPGVILHLYSIRWAIENGFKLYDFLRGNEPYKYMFGAKDLHLKVRTITTKTKQNLQGMPDKRALPRAFALAAEMHEQARAADAERALRQILEADARHAGALLLMAKIELARAQDLEAAKYLKAHLEVNPANPEAWLKLGKIQAARKDNEGAIKSFKKVVELDPKNREAQQELLNLYPLQPAKPVPAKPAFGILSK